MNSSGFPGFAGSKFFLPLFFLLICVTQGISQVNFTFGPSDVEASYNPFTKRIDLEVIMHRSELRYTGGPEDELSSYNENYRRMTVKYFNLYRSANRQLLSSFVHHVQRGYFTTTGSQQPDQTFQELKLPGVEYTYDNTPVTLFLNGSPTAFTVPLLYPYELAADDTNPLQYFRRIDNEIGPGTPIPAEIFTNFVQYGRDLNINLGPYIPAVADARGNELDFSMPDFQNRNFMNLNCIGGCRNIRERSMPFSVAFDPNWIVEESAVQDPKLVLEYDVYSYDFNRDIDGRGSERSYTDNYSSEQQLEITIPRPTTPEVTVNQPDTLCTEIPVEINFPDRNYGDYLRVEYKEIGAPDSEYRAIDLNNEARTVRFGASFNFSTATSGGKTHYRSPFGNLVVYHNSSALSKTKQYFYRVYTYNILGQFNRSYELLSQPSAPVTRQLIQTVPPPTGLQATEDQCGEIELTWTPAGLESNVIYEIWRSVRPDQGFSRLATVNQSSTPVTRYTDRSTLVNDQAYFYKIKVANSSCPNITGSFSAVAEGKSYNSLRAPFEAVINSSNERAYTHKAPQATQSNASDLGIQVDWLVEETVNGVPVLDLPFYQNSSVAVGRSAFKGERTTFTIARSEVVVENGVVTNEGPYLTIEEGVTETTFTDETTEACVFYVYRIEAENGCGPVTYRKTTPIAPFVAPNPVQGFTASAGLYPDKVRLNWALRNYAGSYSIYRRIKGELNYRLLELEVEPANQDFYDDFTAETGALYEYKIVPLTCDSTPIESRAVTASGFFLGYGKVTGKVVYNDNSPSRSVMLRGSLTDSLTKPIAHSISFDLAAPGITIPDDDILNPDQFTISLLFKSSSLSGSSNLFSKGDATRGYSLYLANNRLHFDAMSTMGPINLSVEDTVFKANRFNRVSVSVGEDSLNMYVNGHLMASTRFTANSLVKPVNIPLILGGGFAGKLDEISMWNKVKTAREIENHRNAYLDPFSEGLIAYWQADENFGDRIHDVARNDEIYHVSNPFDTTLITFSNPPEPDALSPKAFTNRFGEYTLPYLPYRGDGAIYLLEPLLDGHAFEHVQTGTSTYSISINENNISYREENFYDLSSFDFKVIVRFNESCRTPGIFVQLDGEQLFTPAGDSLKTDSNGEAFFQVPQGNHTISVFRKGHVFRGTSSFTDNFNVTDYGNGQGQKTFFDDTRVRVAGRVNGGTIQTVLPLLNNSPSNIGRVGITFTDTRNCDTVRVVTNPSGVYEASLLPSTNYQVAVFRGSYNPSTGEMANDVADPVSRFFARSTSNTDGDTREPGKNPPEDFKQDDIPALLNEFNANDTIFYHVRQNYTYRSRPEVFIANDPSTKETFRGDEQAIITTLDRNGEEQRRAVNLFDNNGQSYLGNSTRMVTSGVNYNTYISAEEVYRNYGGEILDTVRVENGTITVNNGLALVNDQTLQFTLADTLTVIQIPFRGAQPNFTSLAGTSGPTPDDFTKKLVVNYSDNVEYPGSEAEITAYVVGTSPVESPSLFSAPESVNFILRDPPGSNSSATLSEGYTYSRVETTSNGGGNTFGVQISPGLKTTLTTFVGLGGGVITEQVSVSSQVEVKPSISTSGSDDFVETTTFSFSEEISTSSDPELAGAPSDLFIGDASVFEVGLAQQLSVTEKSDTCTRCSPVLTLENGEEFVVQNRDVLNVSEDSVEAVFVHSAWEIENKIIPTLEDLIDQLYSRYDTVYDQSKTILLDDNSIQKANYNFNWHRINGNVDENSLDSVAWYQAKIDSWTNALERNEREKVESGNGEFITFGAGSNVSRSYSIDTTTSNVSNFNLQVSLSVSKDFKVRIFGSKTGIDIQDEVYYNYQESTAFDTTENQGVSYTLSDGDNGDFYNVEVVDAEQLAPVFKLQGGQSMCPWLGPLETKYYQPGTEIYPGSAPRENPKINPKSAFIQNVSEHNPAVLSVDLGNESPTGDIQWYGLKILDATNPNGAIVQLNQAGGNPNRVFEIPPGESVRQQISVRKPKGSDIFLYEDLKLMLYSTCEYDFFTNGGVLENSDTLSVTVQFDESCADVAIRSPNDMWTINTDNLADDDKYYLPLVFEGTGVGTDNFLDVRLQYRSANNPEWNTVETFYHSTEGLSDTTGITFLKDVADAAGYGDNGQYVLRYQWDVTGLPDGDYELRAKTNCKAGIVYNTPFLSGTKDTQRPVAFGDPQPASGILTPSDEIKVRFNETVNPQRLTKDNFQVAARTNPGAGAGIPNVSAFFNGNSEHTLEIPEGINLLNQPQFSISAMIRVLANGGGSVLRQGGDNGGWELSLTPDNRLRFSFNGQEYTGSKTLPRNQWRKITVIYDARASFNLAFRVERQLDEKFATEVPQTGSTDPIVAGGFTGNLHGLSIWEKAIAPEVEAASYGLVGAEEGLLGFWQMDEGHGKVLQDRAFNRNARLNADWEISRKGSAAQFNGNGYLYLTGTKAVNPVNYGNTTNFTIEFWFNYPATPTGKMTLFAKGIPGSGKSWSISINANDQLVLDHNDNADLILAEGLATGTWQHLALVVNRFTQVSSLLNGKRVNTFDASNFGGFDGALSLGARAYEDGNPANGQPSISDQFYNGAMDEVRLWQYARSLEQINDARFSRADGRESGLNLYFPFELYENTIDGQMYTATFDPVAEIDINGERTVQSLVSFYEDQEARIDTANISLIVSPILKQPEPISFIDFTYLVSDDEILIDLNARPEIIENRVLTVTAADIFDLNDNRLASPLVWTAFIKQNQLQWEENNLSSVVEVGSKTVLSTTISNQGGTEQSYQISGLPAWLTVSPVQGLLEPDSEQTITFEIKEGLNIGRYEANLSLDSELSFTDKLLLAVKVEAIPPAWSVSASDYEGSMSVVGAVEVNGNRAADEEDMVAAFVDDSLRGVTKLQYVEEYDQYFAFLDIYGKSEQQQAISNQLEAVSFRYWDASDGTTYANLTPNDLRYADKSSFGTPGNPVIMEVNQEIYQSIPMERGWNWFSFNVNPTQGNNPERLFEPLNASSNDEIKREQGSQSNVLIYQNQRWIGNMEAVTPRHLYKLKISNPDTLLTPGQRVAVSDRRLPLNSGWNRVGFVSELILSVNEAMSSVRATEGDLVKGQRRFAVYDEGLKEWIGSLSFMEPGEGYMINLASGDNQVLTYPSYSLLSSGRRKLPLQQQGFERATDYAYNMNIVARAEKSIEKYLQPGTKVWLWADEEKRGVGELTLYQGIPYFFITAFANTPTEQLHFTLQSPDRDEAIRLTNSLIFKAESVVGSLTNPYPLTTLNKQPFSLYPNPLREALQVTYRLNRGGRVKIELLDLQGRKMGKILESDDIKGVHQYVWNGKMDGERVKSGLYLIRFSAEKKVHTQKLIIQ